MDRFSPAQRSAIMRKVKSKNTGPELTVRKLLRRWGLRYTLHKSDLPGNPDVVLECHRIALFVHGCFWHGHSCEAASLPKSNRGYWQQKRLRNTQRDSRNTRRLRKLGWRVLRVWECKLGDDGLLRRKLTRLLKEDSYNVSLAV